MVNYFRKLQLLFASVILIATSIAFILEIVHMIEIKKIIKVTYIIREYDKYCYPFAKKGYFAFKEQIPKILSKFL